VVGAVGRAVADHELPFRGRDDVHRAPELLHEAETRGRFAKTNSTHLQVK
jgi:hypothetical protein